jgi:protein-S-isoprenylcysteine O-methyltransferase Ste14
MSLAFLTILLLNFCLIILLPKIFFRRDGKFNLMWWITGLPIGLSPFAVLLQHQGLMPAQISLPSSEINEVVAVVIHVLSFSLMTFTLGTHRIPLALWHQNNDDPKQIVTWGAYKRIRHPFYTSFITALVAALIAAPNAVTLFSLVYGFVILNATASREEKKLSGSEFGQEYIDYMKVTGRFFPKV